MATPRRTIRYRPPANPVLAGTLDDAAVADLLVDFACTWRDHARVEDPPTFDPFRHAPEWSAYYRGLLTEILRARKHTLPLQQGHRYECAACGLSGSACAGRAYGDIWRFGCGVVPVADSAERTTAEHVAAGKWYRTVAQVCEILGGADCEADAPRALFLAERHEADASALHAARLVRERIVRTEIARVERTIARLDAPAFDADRAAQVAAHGEILAALRGLT